MLRFSLTLAASLLALGPAACQEPTLTCPADGAPMVLIPAGSFAMGDAARRDARPVHEVFVDAFYLDVHEVTNAQFKAFLDANPDWAPDRVDPRLADDNYLSHWQDGSYLEGQGERPVVNVSWHAAAAYAAWAGKRLPTEAEWERAASGPDGTRYAWGDTWDPAQANVCREVGHASEVCSYEPNAYGLCDMSGNVLEWCADWYGEDYYAASPARNPTGPDEGPSHVIRGGAWHTCADRSTTRFRFFQIPTVGDRACTDFLGFRCALDPPADPA